MLAAAHNQHSYYLKTLSFLSSKMKNPDLRDALFASEDPMEVYNMLIK